MHLWTKCPITIKRSSFRDGHGSVAIPDKRENRDWSYTLQEVEAKYADLLASLNTEFVILFTTLKRHSEEWLARMLKNGLAIQYAFPAPKYAYDVEHEPQLHVYPLIMLPWFQKKYRSERSETDPIMFVDGKVVKWTKDICFNCPQMLDRSLKQCSAVHDSCTRPLVDEKKLPDPNWIAEHATITDNVEGFQYRLVKDMAVVEPFEPFTIFSLTTDEAEVKKLKDKRSDAATTAAQSRFVREVACKQCLRINWCGGFRRGGSWCEGLHLAEDYNYIYEKCETWMAHVMLLTQQGCIDQKVVKAWAGTRASAYVLKPYVGTPTMDPSWYDKYKNDLRCVVLMRACGNNPTTYVPYAHACKLLNVQPVNKWNELPPSYKTSRSLRAVAYGLANGRIHSVTSLSSGWGGRSVELTGITFEAGKFVTLEYDNTRRSWCSRYRLSEQESFYSDLLAMPGMHHSDSAAFAGMRLPENSIFSEAIMQHRLSVTIDEVKEACRKFGVKSIKVSTHPPQVYEWLEERSKERCRQKRRSSKQPASSTPGETATAT